MAGLRVREAKAGRAKPALTDDFMYQRILAKDRLYDGRFKMTMHGNKSG